MFLLQFVIAAAVLTIALADKKYGYYGGHGPSSEEEDHKGYDEQHDGYEEDTAHEYDSHENDVTYSPKPYHFGYEIEDHNGKQHRHEHSDGDGTVKGSYGFVDENGVHRQVYYVADEFGFRAQVLTNEKGTESTNPADVQFHSLYKPHQDIYKDTPKL